MQPILETLAKHLIYTGNSNLGNTSIILPNRRAGLFLQRHLATHTETVEWSPHIFSINDFINEISLLNPSDPIDLLFALYDIYRDLVDLPDPFDEFYHWGEMMIKDFDELDKYLVDANMLFSNIIDLKELEEPLAGLEEEQVKFVRQFWESFHAGDQTREKEQFLEVWKRLPVLYTKLREQLVSTGEGYQGMQYREVTERIDHGVLEAPSSDRIIIAGFNALNSCEKRIFSWLKGLGAEFYWDYDHQYTDDESSEAGRFLRSNLAQFPPLHQLEDFNVLDQDKPIRIFELPTDVLQAKIVHRILNQEDADEVRDCTHTALVLCDEELLMPVIMSLPEHVEEINVTMGYPMKNTPVYSFIDLLLRMQHNIRTRSDGSVQFYHKDVSAILLHPYLRSPDHLWGQNLHKEMTSGNLIMVDQQLFLESPHEKIFRKVNGVNDMLNYLRDIFLNSLENLSGQDNQLHQELDREFMFQLLIQLNKLDTILNERPEISLAVFERLFRKMLSVLRVPFEGEPLSGLQLMGILETRLLDFKHVILLSMNEEVMPGSNPGQSYIPYALRIAFNMPAKEDMDAIYAYYFNRLLQRAEKIDLVYNSGSEGVRTGEMSRYLYQVIYGRGIEVIRPGMEVVAREIQPVVIQHTPAIAEKLEKYTSKGLNDKYLSPSAINTYIDCSLKFYLRYLAGIGEPKEVQEEIDAAGFGTVVHDTIRMLYQEIAERNQDEISQTELKSLIDSGRPEEVLKKVFIRTHFKGKKKGSIEGRNIIIIRVMLGYLKKIIQTDIKVAPFTLVSVEDTYRRTLTIEVQGNPAVVRMGGKIDRVDRIGDSLRVIDYKTGEAKQGFPSLEALFESNLSSRNGAALQTLFYAWLVSEDYSNEKILPGLYVMKSLYKDDFDPSLMMGSHSSRRRIDSFAEQEEEYLELLKNSLSSIFDPKTPFVQTTNEMKCKFCDFASICNRTFID